MGTSRVAVVAIGLIGSSLALAKPVSRRMPPRAPEPTELAARVGEAIRNRNVKALTALLAPTVKHDGAWFPDAACAKRFGTHGTVTGRDVGILARCLAGLDLQATTRQTATPRGAVITFAPGIELELEFTGDRLSSIGAEHPDEVGRGRPTLTVVAFEALRKSGTTLLDGALAKKLTGKAFAWVKVCLDKTGAATPRIVAATEGTREVFLAAIADWTFRPFEHRRIATPACSLSLLSYPGATAPATETLPSRSGASHAPTVHTFDFEGTSVDGIVSSPQRLTISASQLELRRIRGTRQIVPDPATRAALAKTTSKRLMSILEVCVDPAGKVSSSKLLRTSGMVDYDRKLVRECGLWRFQPHVVNGVPVATCSRVTFLYKSP